jgi:hypothetical protein
MMTFVVTVAFGTGTVGCGGDEWEPSGIGPVTEGESAALADPTIAGSMAGDMMALPEAIAEVQSALSGSDGSGNQPRVFYLDYADGSPLPKTDVNACKGTPPKFMCKFGSTLDDCQKQVQAYLDKWFADFNVVFTFTRPTSGKFYTEVVSSGGGAWCGVDDKVAGVAPFLCKDLQGGVAYTFLGGNDAKQTAIIIAQEGAHLMGLEHTSSNRDLMYPTICTNCNGFVDEDLAVDGDRCDRATQNSYEMIKKTIGAWPGGPKPSAFGCMDDEAAPGVKVLEPADGAHVNHDFVVKIDARDDCKLAKVGVTVMPQGLSAESKAPPFEWDLTDISGPQTITVTATDGAGHVSTTSVTVNAPTDPAGAGDSPMMATAGCTVASGAFSFSGLIPSLAMMLLFARGRRRTVSRRRRRVTGALDGRPHALPGFTAEGGAGLGAEGASAVAVATAQIPLRR